MLEKWDAHVTKWSNWGKKENSEYRVYSMVDFWFDRKDSNLKFWFYSLWFDKKLYRRMVPTKCWNCHCEFRKSIYTSNQFWTWNIKIFNGIAQDEKFEKQYHDKLDELLIKTKKVRSNYKDDTLNTLINRLNEYCLILEPPIGTIDLIWKY